VTGLKPPSEQLEAVLRHAADAITVQRPDGTLAYANLAAARALGYESPEELLATPLREVMSRFELLDEDGQPLPPDRLPGRRALAGETGSPQVVRFRSRGSTDDRWSLVQAIPIAAEDGNVSLVINTFQDISELKRTERRLRLLADAGALLGRSDDYQETLQQLADTVVPDIADWCVVDVADKTTPLRRVAVAHVDPAKKRLAEEIERRYPPNPDRPGSVADVIRTGQPMLVGEITEEMLREAAVDDDHLAMLREAGLGSAVIAPLVARGQVLGAMTLVTAPGRRPFGPPDMPLVEELARRAALAVDNARLLHEATEAVRLRDDFLAMASHDMRTPLAVILANVQLARRRLARGDADTTDVIRHLESAERTTQRMTGLVGELMDISMLRTGESLPLRLEEMDLAALAASAVDEYARLTERHTITLTGDERVIGTWDAGRVERVLRNLLDNALKYSPEGGDVTVEVRTDDDGRTATLAVSDQGVGIPEDELPMLFEKFHRGSNTRDLRGTGLGLAGSLAVVQQLGGTITVESRLNEGSRFTVRLPLEPEAPPQR
jgi:PAS domain S-box-containing protein